jgi:hypothetical protein
VNARLIAPFVVLSAAAPSCGGGDGDAPEATATEPASDSDDAFECDQDADGHDAIECEGGTDCDDTNPDIKPSAEDILWTVSTVDTALLGDDVVTALTVDGGGGLHAIYSDGSDAATTTLWHAVPAADGTWTPTEITSGESFRAPTVLADGTTLHALVSTSDAGTPLVRHAVFDGGWTVTDLGPGSANGQALVRDGAGDYVAVTDNAGMSSLWTYDGTWVEEPIGALESPIAVVTPDGSVRVIGRLSGGIQLCDRGADSWACANVTSMPRSGSYGLRNRAAYDAGGTLHLVSIDNIDTERLAHRDLQGEMWTTTMLSFLPSPDHGLSVVSDGTTLHVAAWSIPLEEGALSYASFTGGTWTVDELVISGDRVGWEPSMVVDPSGGRHVIFAETIQDDLMYAVRTADGIDQDCDGVDG